MKPLWDDLDARARGLATHLLTRAQLESRALEPDLRCLGAALQRDGIIAGELSPLPGPEELELGVRRWAGRLLHTLERWAGSRTAALPLLFDEEDRRSVRALFRGAVGHVPPERRLAGLIPTPTLPERALQELANIPTSSGMAALLAAWRHPFAEGLLAIAAATRPDLFRLDLALARLLASRAQDAARRSKDRELQSLVRESIDLENALSAITLTVQETDVAPKEAFLPGGALITIGVFEEAVGTGTSLGAAHRLARALRGGAFADVFRIPANDPAMIEDELLRRRVQAIRVRARLAPLGALPVLWVGWRIRAQVTDLQRIIWTVALHAPRARVAERAITVAP